MLIAEKFGAFSHIFSAIILVKLNAKSRFVIEDKVTVFVQRSIVLNNILCAGIFHSQERGHSSTRMSLSISSNRSTHIVANCIHAIQFTQADSTFEL